MLHELELVFIRDEESGKPFLATLNKDTNELHEAILEDIIDSHVKGTEPVPVLVTYHDDGMDIDMNELFRLHYRLTSKKVKLLLETADGRTGRFVKRLSNPEYPFMIILGAEGNEISLSYSASGECCTGRSSDRITKYHESNTTAHEAPKKPAEKKAEVDSNEFPEEVPDDFELN